MSNLPAPQTPGDALAVREQAAAQRAEITRSVQELKQRQADAKADLERRRAEMEADFRRQAAELEAMAKPLQEQLAKMQEVLWTVNLYLGRDETIQLLREGKPAPADTPISIRQRVLVMAEESLILTGGQMTGMNADNIPHFVNWLLADDANLSRVLPEPKGVVVLIPTKVESRTGNAFEDAARNAANQSSYWLLRNGERLHLLTVDESLRIFDRVLPKRTEFTEVFDRGLFGFGRAFGQPVEPGSEEWMAMEKIADARQRHFMRILLVLQGIIDRTPVWHPLPEGGVSLLRLADQESGRIELIQDGDDSLQLTDGREDFRAWQLRLNRLLRPGMRVVGNWDAEGFREMRIRGGAWQRDHHPRLSPASIYCLPDGKLPHLIEGRRDGGLLIRFQRTDQVWRKYEEPVPDRPGYVYRGERPETPTQRASLVIKSDDDWVLPYDVVTLTELQAYLNSREERSKHFLDMVPTIQSAIDAKQAEAATEAPFRGLLARLLEAEGADPSESSTLVDELVHWWKVANTWARPLNGEPKHEARAAKEIVAEYRNRLTHAADTSEATMIAAGRRISGAIAVARNRQGKWFAYSPSILAHDKGVFLDVTPLRKDGSPGTVKRWQTPQTRSITALHVAWSAPEWDGWTFGANPRHYLTGPERQLLVAELLAAAPGIPLCVTEFHDPQDPADRFLAAYTWTADTTAADAETLPLHDPLSWHHDGLKLVTCTGRKVVKDAGGVRLMASRLPRAQDKHFGGYSPSSPWGDIPWWPDDATRYTDVRPRLVWMDEPNLDDLAGFRRRCRESYEEQHQLRQQFEAEVYRYVLPVQAAIMASLTAEARTRFLEDYGRDAEDLWESHLKSLRLRSPIHDRTLWGIIAIRLKAGLPVTGETLGDLAQYAHEQGNRAPGEWHPDRGVQDMHGHEELIVPEPEPAEKP
ncbi:hypothetical protein LG293_16720 (plasmid) [Citricoccus nitrophenolicus]